ncbi:ion transporter [Tenggerimyces flavus]|uniref:Ion transporter n=1 Tax=Tenggerimyces flavus TaxID=1708749 RepID=A0ABV7YBI0_9ACTN|nr:ion transporter [Tenggerimyces flavus]MBM7788972.1 voltage-gated sodium channel [Tenggerimyces flavus]
MRENVRRFVEKPSFQRFITAVIVANAITLGLETSQAIRESVGDILHFADRLMLAIFVIELVLRIYAYGKDFFKDSWGVFDLVVVAIALVPASGPFAVVRALRVLRVLRLISQLRSMRRVVSGLLTAMPGMASTGALLGLIIYVAAVIATNLFGAALPENFGDLGTTLFTLFQIMTGEAWPDIARELMQTVPFAWIFFVIYILISSFAVLNLFIAVVVSAMEEQIADERRAEEAEHDKAERERDQLLLDEVRALRRELADLREHVSDRA